MLFRYLLTMVLSALYLYATNIKEFNLLDSHYIKDEKIVILNFNESVDIKSAKSSIKLIKKINLATTELSYTINSRDDKSFLLKINEPTTDKIELFISSDISDKLNRDISKIIGEDTALNSIEIDKEKSDMLLVDAPVMVANNRGGFSIRVYFENSPYNDNINNFFEVEDIDNISIEKDIYIDYEDREKLGLKNSYVYIEITSSEFKANSNYRLIIKKGIEDYTTQLKEDKIFNFRSGDRRSSIIFDDKKPYLSNLGAVGFSSTNINSAKLIVEKVTDDNYRYFTNYHKGSLKDTKKFTEKILEREVKLNNPRNEIERQKIVLEDLKDMASSGIYRVTIEYKGENIYGELEDINASKILFVSDIGISLNLSSSQAFVSLLSLSSNMPIENALVELYSANNTLIASAKSDSDGIVILDDKLLKGREPKVIIVTRGDDKSFLTIDKPINKLKHKRETLFNAFIYFQSDIVRPSATINALIDIKDVNFLSAEKIPFRVTFGPINEEPILDEVYITDNSGIIEFNHKMRNSDRTGDYILKVFLGNKVIGKESISVEAFMPPEIENSIKVDKEIYKSNETIKGVISSRYLFGSPASNLSGKLSFTARAYNYSNPLFKDFTFNNELIEKMNKSLYINIKEDITLDESGESNISLPCSTKYRVPSILRGVIGATIMDDTQPVSTYKEIYINPYSAMVGLKIENEDIKSGDEFEAEAILIDPVTDKRVDGVLSVVINEIKWHYSYSDGKYKWESEVIPIDSFTVPANSKFKRVISNNGDFIIELYDRLGGHSSSVNISASGWGYSNISPNRDLKSVDINFENRLYSKGDIIKASLKSPIIDGHILVTLESDRVLWHKLIKISKGSAQIDIPIKNDMKRGIYLHAMAFRKTDTDPSLIPFRAMGYKFVKPNREDRRVKIELNYPKRVTSNSINRLNITTDREAKILISIVDKGILNITEQESPNPFDYFNIIPEEQIDYFDIYDKVMNYIIDGKSLDFGGDEDGKKLKKHLPPENSDRVQPFMLWSKVVSTKDKRLSYDIKVPEFNGEASIEVIAINGDSVGVESGDIIIKDDLIIKPSFPRFILKGDSLEVPIRIFNTTKITKEINLTNISTDNISLTPSLKELKIAPDSSTVVMASLKALQDGKSKIELEVKDGDSIIKKTISLLVMTPYAMQSKVYIDSISSSDSLTIPERYMGGEALITISDNIMGQLHSDLKYLVQYPYGCAEQTSSKISAMFYAEPFMKSDRLLKDSRHYILEGVRKLSSQQNGYGEFGYWSVDGYVDSFSSLYASETLLDLNASGVYLKGSVRQKIINALNNIVDNNSNNLKGKYPNYLRVYAGYILAKSSLLKKSRANMLYDKNIYHGYYISYYYMASILKIMGESKLSDEVYSRLKEFQIKNCAESNLLQKEIFLLFYLNSKHFKKSKSDFDIVKKSFSHLYSTYQKALAFRAISTYLGSAVKQNMTLNIEVNGKTKKIDRATSFIIDNIKSDTIKIEPISGVVNYNIDIYKPLPYPLKNSINIDANLSIKREFFDDNNNLVDLSNIRQGSEFYSEITISNKIKLDNLVLNYRVPSCFQIMRKKINIEDIDYKDVRDDRVLIFLSLDKNPKESRAIRKVRIPLMATTIGECKLPAVTIEAMYDSRVRDYAKEIGQVVVKGAKIEDIF